MHNKFLFRAFSAGFGLLWVGCSFASTASVHINADGRGMPVTSGGDSFTFKVTADSILRTSGFVVCDEDGEPGPSQATRLHFDHDGWNMGSESAFQGIKTLKVTRSGMDLYTCDDSGNCNTLDMQCYVADPSGLGAADTNHFFASSFEVEVGSYVIAHVTQAPTAANGYHLTYSLTVNAPSSIHGAVSPTEYALREGEAPGVDCNGMPSTGVTTYAPGQVISITRNCSVAPAAVGSGSMPLAVASLFPRGTPEFDVTDNVAFVYPVTTQ